MKLLLLYLGILSYIGAAGSAVYYGVHHPSSEPPENQSQQIESVETESASEQQMEPITPESALKSQVETMKPVAQKPVVKIKPKEETKNNSDYYRDSDNEFDDIMKDVNKSSKPLPRVPKQEIKNYATTPKKVDMPEFKVEMKPSNLPSTACSGSAGKYIPSCHF